MLSSLNLESVFSEAISNHLTVVEQMCAQRSRLEEVAGRMTQALLAGNKIVWCGNGGSACDAQHLAAELVGRYRRDRPALASMSLTENAAAVIGIANDYGFHEIFAPGGGAMPAGRRVRGNLHFGEQSQCRGCSAAGAADRGLYGRI
jgi:D-sedoheptulose 7-phosphate isomerase